MRLKLLVVPFSILFALILVIGYIKPDITVLQEKRILLESKNAQLGNLAGILKNIDALTQAIEVETESETFMLGYIPRAIDQERVIDMFNYLASQSGVFVYVINMKDIEVKSPKEETLQVVAGTPILDDGSSVPLPQSPKPKLKAFSAEVEVRGEYANMRDFFNRLAHMNRFHKVSSFSLATPKDDGRGEEQSTSTLTGRFKAEFTYFPIHHVENALNVAVFSKGEFNKDYLNRIGQWANNIVSPLDTPQSGRPNPFQ